MPCCNAAPYKRLQRILHHSCNYTTHATKQCTGLCRVFSFYLPCFAAAVCRVHPAIPHRLCHVGASTNARTLCTDTRHQRRAGYYTGQRSRPIIIRYIRVQGCALLWIHARRCSIPQTMPARRVLYASHARRLAIWHRSAARAHRGSPAAGAWRAARNHWRLPPYLFSGFRPIANRGRQ